MSEQVMETAAVEEVVVEPVVETEVPEVGENFNPDELDFGDTAEGEFQFGKYKLDEYADKLGGFQDEEVHSFITERTQKLEELGFTQEQVDFYFKEKIEEASYREEKSAADIKAELTAKLSPQEKRLFKASNNQLRDSLKGTELEGLETKIMSNPTMVKLVQYLQKEKLGNNPQAKKTFERSSTSKIDSGAALDIYMQKVNQVEGVLTTDKKQAIINDIAKEAINKDEVLKALSKFL